MTAGRLPNVLPNDCLTLSNVLCCSTPHTPQCVGQYALTLGSVRQSYAPRAGPRAGRPALIPKAVAASHASGRILGTGGQGNISDRAADPGTTRRMTRWLRN
jgi:hypothetical protein